METALLELTIREAEPGDEAALLRARAAAFRDVDPRRAERPAAVWRWLRDANPAGRRAMIAVTPAGEVVAQQAGLPRRVRVGEAVVTWTQVVDAFAVPGARRGLGKRGPFVRAAEAFAERWAGPGPDQDQVLYGVPTRAAYRVGKELLGFEVVRNLNLLAAAPQDLRPAAAPGIEVGEVGDVPEDLDRLFERAAQPFGAIAVRDRAFLAWRFGPEAAAATGRRARIAVARRTASGEACGYAVAWAGELGGRAGTLVADWLVDPTVREAGSALRAWLAEVGDQEASGELLALLPEFCEDSLDSQREGFRMRPTRSYQMARSALRVQDMLWLYWNWYYTLADLDLP